MRYASLSKTKYPKNTEDIIESIVNEKLKSYVNDYITTATISVAGGWNSEPETYTVEAYIKKQISEIIQSQTFKTKDRYGNYNNTTTFEDYIKSIFNVNDYVQKALNKFMTGVKNDINKSVTKIFDQTTQAALSSVIMNMLSNSNAFLEMRDNLRRITDGN